MSKATKNAAKISKATTKAASKSKASKAQKSAKAANGSQNASQTPQTPYRAGSCYQAVVNALLKLGKDRFHKFDAIVPAVVAEMDNAKTFKGREKRNDNGLGWKDRLLQNVAVVGRKDRYGEPVRKLLKMEVRFSKREGHAGIFRLGK